MATFGEVITAQRKAKGISQKELASMVLKEDGNPISPQYLNDIERDRRGAPGDHLIAQFSLALDLDKDILYSSAGELPPDLRAVEPAKAQVMFAAFRKTLSEEPD